MSDIGEAFKAVAGKLDQEQAFAFSFMILVPLVGAATIGILLLVHLDWLSRAVAVAIGCQFVLIDLPYINMLRFRMVRIRGQATK